MLACSEGGAPSSQAETTSAEEAETRDIPSTQETLVQGHAEGRTTNPDHAGPAEMRPPEFDPRGAETSAYTSEAAKEAEQNLMQAEQNLDTRRRKIEEARQKVEAQMQASEISQEEFIKKVTALENDQKSLERTMEDLMKKREEMDRMRTKAEDEAAGFRGK